MGVKRCIGALLLTGSSCFSQADSLSNTYVQKFPDKLSVQLFTLNTSNEFSLDYEQEDITVEVVPNSKTTLGVAVQYDFISFSLGFAPKFFTDNKDNKDSKMNSFSLNLFPGKWMQHFDFYYQKGITLKGEGFEDVYMPNLKTMKIGGSTTYVFNKNYSFRALAFQNERQVKSAGSFAPLLSYYYTELNGEKQEGLGGKTYFVNAAILWKGLARLFFLGTRLMRCSSPHRIDQRIHPRIQARLKIQLHLNEPGSTPGGDNRLQPLIIIPADALIVQTVQQDLFSQRMLAYLPRGIQCRMFACQAQALFEQSPPGRLVLLVDVPERCSLRLRNMQKA